MCKLKSIPNVFDTKYLHCINWHLIAFCSILLRKLYTTSKFGYEIKKIRGWKLYSSLFLILILKYEINLPCLNENVVLLKFLLLWH